MADALFDGENLTIKLPALGEFDAERDLYSAWKRWVRLGDNGKFPPAFDTTGGDLISSTEELSAFFFLRNDNGWVIIPADANGATNIKGDLFARDPLLPLFGQAVGFTSFVTQTVSAKAIVNTVTTGSGVTAQDKQDIKNLIFDELLEGSESFAEAVRLMRAVLAGKTTVSNDVVRFRDSQDSKDRVVSITNEQGERTSVSVDGS